MTPRSLRLLGRKVTAAALAVALVLSGSGPIYAQEIRAISGRGQSAGRAGEAGAAALPNMLFPLAPSALNAAPAPARPDVSAPVLTPSAAAFGGHPRELPALARPSLRPSPERGPALDGAKASVQSGDDAALPADAAGGDAKDFADAAFRRLGAEAGASVSDDDAPVVAAPARPSRFDGLVSAQARAHASAPAAAEIPKPEPARAGTSFTAAKGPLKYIYEDFLGFRAVKGARYDPALKPLLKIESIEQVVDHISRQFNVPRARVLELGEKYRLNEFSPLESWIGVYDRLQAANRDQFNRLDAKKYDGWKSFRELANKTYPAGRAGALLRALEFHKHVLGAAVRFPYHLFDMFIFGYFRRAAAFEFRHSGEDFLALAGREKFAEQWLEGAMRQDAFRGAGALAGVRAAGWYRALNRWFIVPVVSPLTTFIVRRLTLAVMSAIAMGLLGAFAPILPLSFALTSIPVFGPAVVAVLNGLPVAVAAVPYVGAVLAPVAAAATTALAKDLILGPLLNTLVLSTLLTFPAAARERIARLRDGAPLSSLTTREKVGAVLGAAVSWEFWRSNLKSFVGLATVGAEIEGIMTYAGRIDAAIDPIFEGALGRKVGLFHAIGASVERPAGESPIPFGGAITWGNVLLYKLQTLAGFNISDAVVRSAMIVKGMAVGEGALDLPVSRRSAQGLIAAASGRTAEQGLPFDADLWRKPLPEVMARIRELTSKAGLFDAELVAVKENQMKLLAELGDKRAKVERLQKSSRPTTAAERSEEARLLAELTAKSDEVGVREKLAERRDLLHPPSDAAALARLEALRKEFTGMTPPPPPDTNGHWEELAAQDASMKALSQRLADYAEGKVTSASDGGIASALTAGTREEIEALVTEIEALRAETKAEITMRDATAQLLSSSNRVRSAALRERRSGADMLRFHTDMSKLATVMDLALSIKEINAAQTAIKQMMDLLEAKRAKIASARADNQRNQAIADKNAGLNAAWKEDINKDIAADDQTTRDIVLAEAKTGMVGQRLGSFQTDVRAFINDVNAQDRGRSVDAAAEYTRRIDVVLPQMKAWRTSGGNPSDPDAFSLKKFNDDLTEVNDNIRKAQEGLSRLTTVPVEFAGVLVSEVPGPTVSVSNPTRDQMRQILADRKVYWQAKRVDFGGSLDSVLRLTGQTDTKGRSPGTQTDEFGDAHPESLPQWLAQSQAEINASQAATRQYLSQLDALAANINRTANSSIPMLSGLGLTQLQEAIKTYGDSLKAVRFAETETLASHTAMMDLVSSAKLVPYAAREIIKWSKADATVTAINDATQNVLPKALTGLRGVVGMLDAVLSDVDVDLVYVNTGSGGGQTLIDRKTVLLRDRILPSLLGARSMLTDTLIPYQQKSIDQVSGADNDFFKLYDAKRKLIVESDKLYNHTMPWAFATFGAADGNRAEATQKIADWRHKLQKNFDTYDDATGHHKGIHEYQVEIANRKDPNFTGTEVQYGETQPFSLPKKISQYTAERSQRTDQVNTQNARINEILGKIETISHGKYVMSSYRLPVGVTADAGGVARVQALVDARTLPNLGDRLKAVADAADAGAASITLGGTGGDGTVPVGTQPPITLSENQQISLHALEAAKLLVPSRGALPDTAPASFAVARMLYSDAVISAANDGLSVQIPAAERFLGRISTVLNNSISDIPKDEAYAASNGTTETADAVFARKMAVFAALNGTLVSAMDFFRLKQGWNQDKFHTLDRVQTYNDSLHDIYTGAQTTNDNEIVAVDKMQEALRKTMSDLEEKRVKVSSWLNQLNPKEKSALSNVSEDIGKIMDRTRVVLEANVDWHKLQDRLGASREILQSQFTQIDAKQAKLAELLKPELKGRLPADLARRIENLRMGGSGWASDGNKAEPASLVIRKSEYGAFVDAVLGMVTPGVQNSAAQVSAIRDDLLRNPQGLASLIPNSKVLDFGDNADGFYLVYQSQFAVPHGLDTSAWVTLGNIGRVFDSNVSVSGYQIASPPSKDGENAPYGDKGVEVQIESLEGKNWVNYLNIDLHRFAFDIPADNNIATGAGENRMMIFDDYAVMLFGDRLYVGLAGFADGALQNTADKPYYYGGNLKSSLKLTEVMKLKVEERALFAKDPRSFLQNVNLDFTGYDAELNRNFPIMASGDQKNYFRTQAGSQFDLNRLMNPDGGGDTFTLDLYWAKTSGTDDINQNVGGVSVLKGFSLMNKDGKPWMRIDNRATGEIGQKQNEIGDRLSVSFPDEGLVVSGEGKIIGGAQTYFGQVSKKLGDHVNASLGYGSQYVGMNNRLSVSVNTAFTLTELWQKVGDQTAENLRGGKALVAYNRALGDFLASDRAKSSRTAMDLQRVFEADIARKLVTQDIGNLSREIEVLRKAGAVMDNTRVRGMVGFISNAVSNDLVERVASGGFGVGTYTELSLNKTQKQLIESKVQVLYREGLRLQDRMLSLTRDWQASVVEIAEAQWALKMADFSVKNAPSESSRREAAVRLSDAESRLHQAVLSYNALTGRDSEAPPPFQDLNSEDLRQMLVNIRGLIASPDRFGRILGGLDEASLKKSIGENPFNVVDWIPWVDRLTVGFGAQYQDKMASQALVIGGSVRLPIYDPAANNADKAYELESKAVREEMKQVYAERASAGQAAVAQARIWEARGRVVESDSSAAASNLSDAIRGYRNSLIGPDKLRAAFENWNWYMSASLESQSRAALLRAQAGADAPVRRLAVSDATPLVLTSIDDAFAVVSANSHSLGEIAKRQQAAEEMGRSVDHRLQKAWLDINVGLGMTARGVGFMPILGITGVPVMPVLGFELKPEEMRELQVKEHGQQAEYYKALKTRAEADLAVQLYKNMAALSSAESRGKVYDDRILPGLRAAAASGAVDAVRRYDAAKISREAARLESAKASEMINFLLGRPAESPVEVVIDESRALADLSSLLAAKDPVGAQRRIHEARVATAKAVEEIIDKDLKVEMLQLEPVSLVVRALGRVIGSFSDSPIFNPEMAAAARIQTLTEERERDAYEGRRAAEEARLGLQLKAASSALRALKGDDPETVLQRNLLASAITGLQADLLARGVDLGAALNVNSGTLPKKWAELKSRLAASEQALTTVAPERNLDLITPDKLKLRSAAFARYYYAHQTIGHEPINRNFAEGWIELRLADPTTPPEVLLALSRLSTDKADRLYRDALLGAAARADMLAAHFEGDARLLRFIDAEIRARNAGQSPEPLNDVRASLVRRLDAQRDAIAARLGLPASTKLSDLLGLVQDEAAPAANLQELSSKLISDIRSRQIDSVRRLLFDGGTPASWGNEDGIMGQIKANTIAERMSYRGFTPVVAFGFFRGTPVAGAFLEAPDPQDIEVGLEKVMGDVLRKEMQSSGRLREVTMRLHSLMVRVEDGTKGLEARRKLIEAAENDLRVRSEISGKDSAEYLAAQTALVEAWDGFTIAMTSTKANFIALVAELEALKAGPPGSWHPNSAPDRPEASVAGGDTKSDLLDYWVKRFTDPSFEAGLEALFARMGAAVTPALRARIASDAASYRVALRDADAIRTNEYTPAEKLDRLTRIDVEGKRLNLRAELEAALRGVGLLVPSNPVAADFLTFMRADLAGASKAFALDRGEKVRIARALSETYWHAHDPTDAEAATFARLGKLNVALEESRDALMASYLADSGGDPARFVLKDLQLDAYLKAQGAFDAEMARALEGRPSPTVVRALEGLYDLREVLDRSVARAKHGRGIAALDALIMLEQSRLRAARWTRQAPVRVDPIAEALSRLKETRERWIKGEVGRELQPLYAVTRLDGEGRRTWAVEEWLTAEQFDARAEEGKNPNHAGDLGAIITRKDPATGKLGRFIDRPLDPKTGKEGTGKFEVIGGADAADAALHAADTKFSDNRGLADLHAKMEKADFVAPGGAGKEAMGWTFAEVFGQGGLHAQGRLFFFEAHAGADGGPSKALHPLDALSRPPEEVVMKVYLGDDGLHRDRFPTLKSLEASDAAGSFKTLTVSPSGASKLIANERRLEAAERGRGWIEVKLNSFGFARDEKGQVSQLYRTKDDFEAEWKSYDNAVRDLDTARRDLKTATAEKEARESEVEAAKASADRQSLTYQVAQARLREALRAVMIESGFNERVPSFKAELDRRVASPKFVNPPERVSEAHRQAALGAHEAYASEVKAMALVEKTFNDASSMSKLARARAVTAGETVRAAELTLARSQTWALHRTADLALGLDSDDRVVHVAAPGARAPGKIKDLNEAVAGGGPSLRTVSGVLLAAVVDEDGRLRRAYSGRADVDAAFKGWTLRSYRAGGDVIGADGDEALTKVRFSHYEETIGSGKDAKILPVLLGEPYLLERFEGAKSALWKVKHWSYMPFNWGNIALEIPRAVSDIPSEFAGRDPRQHHYLGRAYMYKTEGGSTEHHGFFRSIFGVVDVLNLLPDPADRFFDPSQFPDKVSIDSALRPGQGLWSKDLGALVGDTKKDVDVHLGRGFLARQKTHAEMDLEATRVRTLSRFHGGVEQLTLETRRGRNGWYQESTRTAELGAEAISRRLSDGAIASDPLSGGSAVEGRGGDVVTSETPGHLFVDLVERRVRVRPGADAYVRQAAALDGYGERVSERGRKVESDRAKLEEDRTLTEAELTTALAERAQARADQGKLISPWHQLAQRIGAQIELEKRIVGLQDEIKALEDRLAFEDRYLRLLGEARLNSDLPFGPNPMFWAWLMMLSFLGALASALWHWLRRSPGTQVSGLQIR